MGATSTPEPSTFARTSEGKAAEIERLIAPALGDLSYAIVRVLLSGDQRAKLQIMVERQDGQAITVEDCATVSRTVAALLDVSDPIHSAYVLEVSSPGIDRPLTRLQDFERFTGFEARIELRRPIEGKRRFHGRLCGLSGAEIRLATESGELRLPSDEVVKAKLLLTDELIAAAQKSPGLGA